ncbi:MAG: galactokinase [Bacteroidetes bacterium GWF2_49_14]|nr:MAG: galactokinase [Bacteroidetes bacterium GWF2_49_14]
MTTDYLRDELIATFGTSNEEIKFFFSPGRVNLIGEHTDYNGGYVFPCALSFGTYLAVRKTSDPVIRMATTNFNYRAGISLDKLNEKHGDEWVNYPLGVFSELAKKGFKAQGLEMLYSGNIPNKSGLSSSASIELVTAVALDTIYKLGYDRVELVKIGRAAENHFVGVNCGIMDQFAVGMGKKDHAIYLNCDTLDYELVPMNIAGYKLVIANTNKSRGLADSKYNERVAECQAAVQALQPGKKIQYLAELTGAEFAQYQHLITDQTVMRRARHAVLENERTSLAVKTLKEGDLFTFGQLMNDSHDSLRYDYEVTGIELDTLVEETRKIPGVIGSRMTGAGFGGCTVSLVKDEAVENLIRTVGPAYQAITGLTADFYVAEIGDGAKQIK